MFFRRKTPKRLKPKVEGYIGLYGLADWWLETFTDEERSLIAATYKPLGLKAHLTTGNPELGAVIGADHSKRTALEFLTTLSGWFKRKDQRPIALRMLQKAAEFDGSVIDWHFYYDSYISLRSAQMKADPNAKQDVIMACEAMIALAPEAVRAFKKYFGSEDGVPPSHTGYAELIIIRSKDGDQSEAGRLQKEFKQVWRN